MLRIQEASAVLGSQTGEAAQATVRLAETLKETRIQEVERKGKHIPGKGQV